MTAVEIAEAGQSYLRYRQGLPQGISLDEVRGITGLLDYLLAIERLPANAPVGNL